MDRGLVTLIGMSIAYAASFVGLGLAWWSWRRHQRSQRNDRQERQPRVDR